MRLQTIEFPSESICSSEEMYFHRQKNQLDFDGYFNLFYIEKRKKYCSLGGLKLVIRLKGASEIRLMHNRELLRQIPLDEQAAECEYEFEFPYQDTQEGVFWFSLRAKSPEHIAVSGYYEGMSAEYRPVSIAAVICTYKREHYVYRNLQCFKQVLNQKELEISRNLRLFLVDNGQTL